MNRWTVLLTAVLMTALIATGCSGGGVNPVIPTSTQDITGALNHTGQTHLWGYYDVIIDLENEVVETVSNRTAMFTCNTVNFLNSCPVSPVDIDLNAIVQGTDYLDLDLDVTLTHPFPGMPQFHGYDVRGIFMGDGSATLGYNSEMVYPVLGTDQFMFENPAGTNGAPDGYSRWFNITEFADPAMLMFGYTPGNLAPADFAGTAILSPYKYFADGLATNDNLCSWLKNHPNDYGQFSSGATNTRNYYLRFPTDKGLMYGYAITANWEGPGPECHPSNMVEAAGCDINNNSTVFYVDSTNNGGDLIFDVSMYGWGYQPSTIFIESTVLSSVYEMTGSEMIPTGGGDNYSTYHVEIPADNVLGEDDNEYWVIAQYDGFDYTNEFGILNEAWEDTLAAYFRFDLPIGENPRINIYVDGDNDSGIEDGTMAHPYDTIMEAVNAAPTYSLVHVDAVEGGNGYYEEAVELKTDCWIHGDNWNGGEGKPRIHVNSAGGFKITVPHVHGDDVSLIEFDNFELTTNEFEIEHWGGSGNGGFQLIRLGNCSDITIRNCRIGTTASLYFLFGIRAIGGSNLTIEHNEIVNLHNTRDYNWSALTCGILAKDIENCIIRQNEVHHINYQSVHNSGDARLTHTELISCFNCTPGLEITNNLLYDAYDFSTGDATLTGSYCRHNYVFGIRINNCPDGYIANNTMDDFNPVARAGNQAGKVRGILFGGDGQPAESIVVKNNIASNLVATEITSETMFYGAGYYGAFPVSVDYSNVYNLDLTNGGAEYYNLAVKGTGSYDNADMQDPNYNMTPGVTFYHIQNSTLVSDDGTEMGAFGGPGGNWIPPSQE